MRLGQWWRLAAGVAAAAAAAIGVGTWLLGQAPALAFDQSSQARAMRPSIIAYLQSPSYRDVNGEASVADYLAQRVRWLCNPGIVEIRPDGTRWRVGMDVVCGDFRRSGNTVVLEDGGDQGHALMILSSRRDGYRVVSAALEPGITSDPGWVDRHFSAGVAAAINASDGFPVAAMPTGRMLQAFGCGTGAVRGSVVRGSVVSDAQGSAWEWPCLSS